MARRKPRPAGVRLGLPWGPGVSAEEDWTGFYPGSQYILSQRSPGQRSEGQMQPAVVPCGAGAAKQSQGNLRYQNPVATASVPEKE